MPASSSAPDVHPLFAPPVPAIQSRPPSSGLPPPQEPPPAPWPRIDAFLHLPAPTYRSTPPDPEEGLLRVILQTMHRAMLPLDALPASVTTPLRDQLRQQLLMHLSAQFDGERLDAWDRRALDTAAGKLVAAVLDGAYPDLLGPDRIDTLRAGLFDADADAASEAPRRNTVLLRRWGIGDLSDNGVEAVPPRLRGAKTPVHRASALMIEGLLAAAYLVEGMFQRQAPSPLIARRIAFARSVAYTMASGLTRSPLLFDLDRLQREATRTSPEAAARHAARKAIWPAQRLLSDLGLIGPLTYLSGTRRDDAHWHRIGSRSLITEDDGPFRQLLGLARPPVADTAAVLPSPARSASGPALPLLESLMPRFRQRLDRVNGRVILGDSHGQVFAATVPALGPEASDARIREQDRRLDLLDAFIVSVFGSALPLRPGQLPPAVSLAGTAFLVGTLPVASQETDGRWHFDHDAVQVVRDTFGNDAAVAPTRLALSRWMPTSRERPTLPVSDTPASARSDLLRLYLQMEDDDVTFSLGNALSDQYPQQLVWVQMHPQEGWRVVRGQSLLENAGEDVRLWLYVTGHGRTDPRTGERLLSGRGAEPLARELTSAVPGMSPRDRFRRRVERIFLQSCALETPAVHRRFGLEFARAVRPLGGAGIETTVHSQRLLLRTTRQGRLIAGSRQHDGTPARRGAAGLTWIYRVDAITGRTTVRDMYPDGDEGIEFSHECCAILKATPPRGSGRSQALVRAKLHDWYHLRRRFQGLANQHRPAGMHLLPVVPDPAGAGATLSYMSLADPAIHTLELVDAADVQVIRAGMQFIRSGLASLPDLGLDSLPENADMGMLNVGLLALLLSDLADGAQDGDAYQKALWSLGLTQGAAQAGSDVLPLVAAVRAAAARPDAGTMADVVTSAGLLEQALRWTSRLAQVGSLVVDMADWIESTISGDRLRSQPAGLRVALDEVALGLIGVTAAMDVLGEALLASAIDSLAVPLAGLALGIQALNRAVEGERLRLARNLEPLRQIELGYGAPLAAAALDPRHPERRMLLPNGWAPMKRINLVSGTVSFADATIGASSLDPRQLYWQWGSHRLHDAWVLDGADRQGHYSEHGMDLDLWTLMRRPANEAFPRTALAPALRDPGLALCLMTAPNLEIRHGSYSSSRAGGDFALLGDPLIERMQENSGAAFVGDFVSSSSFARSADLWRIVQKPSLLEVVLDDRHRTLVLPERSSAELETFQFQDHPSRNDGSFRPLDQSQVHIRLIGGGGRYTLVLPTDGTVRNPVCILPSGTDREVWTLMLRNSLFRGGKDIEFIDGGVAGLRVNGQSFHFEAVHDAIVQIADPMVPGIRLVLDMARKQGSLVLTLPTWSPALDPGKLLADAVGLLVPPTSAGDDATTSSPTVVASLVRRNGTLLPQRPVQLAGLTADGETLSGVHDPLTGSAMLLGSRHLLVFDPAARAEAAWTRLALNGGQVSIDSDGRPVVRYDGSQFFAPITFTYLMDQRRFRREPLAMTRAGELALRQWLTAHPGWIWPELRRFLTEDLAGGLALAGPEGAQATPVDRVDFHERLAEGRRPTQGTVALSLWERVDRAEQRTPAGLPVRFDGDPGLVEDLIRAGFDGFIEPRPPADVAEKRPANPCVVVSREEAARARQWLVLQHLHATGAYGPWSDLHPPALPLTLHERTRLTMLHQGLQRLFDKHLRSSDNPAWIKLGESPQASAEMAHQLRDAGVELLIDQGVDAPGFRSTNRAGPRDFYDVQVPTFRLLMHDLSDRLERDAAASRRVEGGLAPAPEGSALQLALASLAGAHEAVKPGAAVIDVPWAVMQQVERAGLTWRVEPKVPDGRDTSPAGSRLGAVRDGPTGASIDAATLRLWRDQADTLGLRLEEWYALFARPGTATEIGLRTAAREALRERLIFLQADAARAGKTQAPLHADLLESRKLLETLRRLLPPVAHIGIAGRDSVRPGDVVRFDDAKGVAHYAWMREADGRLTHLPVDAPAAGGGREWAYLGRVADFDAGLNPRPDPSHGPAILDPDAYLSWRRQDPTPVPGGVYLYDNPYSSRLELFSLQRADFKPYGPFPIDGRSNADWRYLGNSESLSPAELGALAERPSALQPQAFPLGLFEWWADRLAPGDGSGYRRFSLAPDSFFAEAWDGTVFRLEEDDTVTITLDDGDTSPFDLAEDAAFKDFQRQVLAGRDPPRLLVIQGNGRPVDLDGAQALGVAEIVIADEADGAPRHIDLDDRASGDPEVFLEGLDLLIHQTGSGQLIRIRHARKFASDLPLDDDNWLHEASITGQGGSRRMTWPADGQVLRLPLLTLHGARLEVTRDERDLWIRDGQGWSGMRVPDVFTQEEGGIPGTASGDDEALLRWRAADGTWRLTLLSAALIASMADQLDTTWRWDLEPGGQSALAYLRAVEASADAGAGAEAAGRLRWPLEQARFSESMAAVVDSAGPPLAPAWTPLAASGLDRGRAAISPAAAR